MVQRAVSDPPAAVERYALVVEDSPMMRQLLVFALGRVPNLRVVEADHGVDALRKMTTQTFDIVLTDINMPIMDGLKLTKRIRETHKDMPIVIVTTETAEEDKNRALALGANAYITKPIQAPRVLEVVRELLGL